MSLEHKAKNRKVVIQHVRSEYFQRNVDFCFYRPEVQMEVVDISGLNKDRERVDLIMVRGKERILIGKVEPLNTLPNQNAEFRIFINQDEMGRNAKSALESSHSQKTEVQFCIESFSLNVRIHQLAEGQAAGAFDGVNIPMNTTMMIVTKPVILQGISICEAEETQDGNDSDLFWSGDDSDLMWSGDDSQLMWGNRKGRKRE